MLGEASTTIWRTIGWLSRWVPLALLACVSAAATLYVACFAPHRHHSEHWGLVLIGLSAVTAVGALRRARGLAMWPASPRGRRRLTPAVVSAAVAGLIALELGAFLYGVMDRSPEWAPGDLAFLRLRLVAKTLRLGTLLLLIAGCLAASTYLLRARGRRGFMLTSVLGVGLGVVHGWSLRRLADIPAAWPHANLIIGSLIGLTIAIAFWSIGGVTVATLLERAGGRGAASASNMSPVAWAGFRRAVGLAVAIPIGVLFVIPVGYGTAGMYIFYGAPVVGLGLIALFITCVAAARAAKPFRNRDGAAYAHGKRVGLSTFVLFANALWVVPWSASIEAFSILLPGLR